MFNNNISDASGKRAVVKNPQRGFVAHPMVDELDQIYGNCRTGRHMLNNIHSETATLAPQRRFYSF